MQPVAGAVLLSLAAAVAPAPVATAAPVPAFESVEIERRVEPRLPAGVTVAAPADLAPDDAHLVLQVRTPDGNHVAVTRLDGSGYACVTCGGMPAAFKPTVSADGTKIFVADNKGDNTQAGNPFSGGTGDFNWSIVACAPSVYDCRTRAVLPVRFPFSGLSQGVQNREAKFDPLAHYVSWNEVRSTDGTRVTIARLVREPDRYVLVEPRVLNPTGATGLAGAVDAGRFYEGANFADGGRTLTYQTTTTALNYDSWRIDLATGRREQLSADLDYNEISRYAPDGRSVFFSSARGLDRMSVFTQLVRPSLIDMAAFAIVGRLGLHGNRSCIQGGRLADRDVPQHDGGYAGQPLLLGDNRNIRDWEWFADGRRALVSIQPFTRGKASKDIPSELYVVRLPARRAARPLPTRSLDDFPWRRWTVPADAYTDMFSRSGRQTIAGPGGGTVTLDRAGTFAGGAWTVTYRGFSTDGRTVLDGTESLTTVVPTLLAHYEADLRERGAHTGTMRARLDVGAQTSFRGEVTSTVDGVTRTGVPQQDSCPGARPPALRVAGRAGAARPGGRRSLRVAVTAMAPGDPDVHPVAGAVVRAAGRTRDGLRLRARTDGRGHATLVVPAGRAWRVHASAGTFRGGARTVRAPR